MASRAPPIPPEQRSHPGDRPHVEGRHDRPAGNADLNLKEQGRHGNRQQNVDTVQHKQQDR